MSEVAYWTLSPVDGVCLLGPERVDTPTLVAALLTGSTRRRASVAHRLLGSCGSVEALARLGFGALRDLELGRSEAARLMAAFELSRRRLQEPRRATQVREPGDAYRCVAAELDSRDHERFAVLVLDARNQPLAVRTVARGGVDACPVDLREIFRPAMEYRGSGIIVAHNHPSGDVAPSPEDIRLTRRLVHAGALLGVPLMDHLIVGISGDAPSFSSLAALGHVKETPESRY